MKIPNFIMAEAKPVSTFKALGESSNFIVNTFSDLVTTISQNPLMLLGIGIFVIGGAIGLVHRVLH